MRIHFPQLAFLFAALSLFSEAVLCQTLPFQSYTTRDGLPSNHVTALCQDSRGYLWIGTDNGLSVYDGTEFKNFTTADGLSNLYITDIIESRKQPGTFWIGTIAGGLVKMHGGHFTVYHIGDDNVSSLCEDMEGTLWCSSGGGNFRISNDSALFVSETDRQGSSIEELNGAVVILTGHTLTQFRLDGLESRQQHFDLLKPGEVLAATTVDHSGVLWAFSSEGRLLELDSSLTLRRSLQTPLKPSMDTPPGIMDDGKGLLWITTPRGILLVSKTDHTSRTLSDLGIPFLQPSGQIIKDREGTVWFGTYAHGLVKLLDDRIFRIPLDPVSEAAYNLVACSDTNGHIWISTTSTLTEVARSEAKQWKVFRHPIGRGTTAYASSALMIDPQDKLWVVPIWRVRKPFLRYRIRERTDAMSDMDQVKSILPEELATHGVGLTFAIDQYHRGWFTFGPSGVALVDLRETSSSERLRRAMAFRLTLPVRSSLTGRQDCGTAPGQRASLLLNSMETPSAYEKNRG